MSLEPLYFLSKNSNFLSFKRVSETSSLTSSTFGSDFLLKLMALATRYPSFNVNLLTSPTLVWSSYNHLITCLEFSTPGKPESNSSKELNESINNDSSLLFNGNSLFASNSAWEAFL